MPERLPDLDSLVERLRSWAQNEEMINQYFLQHGKDCNEAADEIERLRRELALYETAAQGAATMEQFEEEISRRERAEAHLATARRWALEEAKSLVTKLFVAARFDKTTHLGLGDIRLTIGYQEDIISAIHALAEKEPK